MILNNNIFCNSTIAFLSALCISILFGYRVIPLIRKIQKKGQPIRSNGPESHFSKAGTPTMGGIIIILPSLLVSLTLSDIKNPIVYIPITSLIGFSLLGFIDDYIKISKHNYAGMLSKSKMFIQLIFSLFLCFLIHNYHNSYNTYINIPMLKGYMFDLGFLYWVFAPIVITGSSNAVNLTDGLDGLAVVPIMIAISCFMIISYWISDLELATRMGLIYVYECDELIIFLSSLIGSALGFLWFNFYPASIFMGDTGSLGLGGLLGTVAVITKNELLLIIIGGLFVIETLSVIAQVGYFKYTKRRFGSGRRIFLMAPLHHHFEKKGIPETKVVVRFWIIGLVLGIISISSTYIVPDFI